MAVREIVSMGAVLYYVCYTKLSLILFSSVLRVTVRELPVIFVLSTKCSLRCSWTCHKILDMSRTTSGYKNKVPRAVAQAM